MKKLFIAVALALVAALAAPSTSSASIFGRKGEPKGAHDKNARGSTKNKHQEANARRQREQAAAAKRQFDAKKAATRRQQAAKQAKAAAKKQGGRGGRR